MKCTTKRLGRPIVVDGVKYHWKVRIYDFDHYGDPVYQRAPKTLWLVVRGSPGNRGLEVQLDQRDGEKVPVTPGMVADYIRQERQHAHA